MFLKFNLIFPFLICGILTLTSCNSYKQLDNSKLSEVSIEIIGMGKQTVFKASENEFSKKTVQRSDFENSDNIQKLKSNLSQNWRKVNDLVSKIDLNKFEMMEAPSGDRLFDGARTAVLTIRFKDKELVSTGFDEGNPPAEIKDLYDYMVSVLNQ